MSAVYYYTSHDASGAAVAGAPSLTGTAGSLIAVLDACLVTGYGATTLTSLVVSGGVATATVQAGHPYLDLQQVLVAGATPGTLNGVQRITRTSATTFTFTTTAPNGAASGTITAKLAPAGWSKPYSGTNLAVYRSTDPAAVPVLYALDDTLADRGRLTGYRTMSSATAGTGRWPASGYIAMPKYATGSTGGLANGWTMVADSRSVLWLPRAYTPNPLAYPCYFGDLSALVAGDSWAAAILGAGDVAGPPSSGMVLSRLQPWTAAGLATAALPSDAAGLATSVDAAIVAALGVSDTYSGAWGPTYPQSAGVLEFPVHVAHGGVPRATLRGVRGVAHVASSLTHLQRLASDTRIALRCFGSSGGSDQTGVLLADLQGPW